MSDLVLYDNDAALKLSAYKLWVRVAAVGEFWPPAILAVARYSLRTQAQRSTRCKDRDRLIATVIEFIELATIIEPTSHELALASELEERALAASVVLDSGESQLVAVLLTRAIEPLVTGDKRALQALYVMNVTGLDAKLFCLEQILLAVIAQGDADAVRSAICAEGEVDKAISNAFSCSMIDEAGGDPTEGLTSYIRDLRSKTGNLLGATVAN